MWVNRKEGGCGGRFETVERYRKAVLSSVK